MAKKSTNPMQSVHFHVLEEFLEYLPEHERVMVERLRQIVLECIPEAHEKLSFNVPAYKIRRQICFIWPASVLWGKKQTWNGVRFGFSYGHLLLDEDGYLDKGNRKQVAYKDFTHLSQIDDERLRTYIFEAVMIDEMMRKG